jgi:hypothetical protein
MSTFQKTTKYEIFKDVSGNRKINRGHVQRLVDAIERKNLLPYFPILLNEDMEVIDGQHRLAAAIKLGYEIYYSIVPGLRIEDVMSINTNSKSWALTDFIDSWIVLDKPDYDILKAFIHTYGINPSVAGQMLQGYYVLRTGHNIGQTIKKGEFKVNSLQFAEKIAEQLVKLKKYCEDFDPMKDRELIAALMRLSTNETFDFEQLMARLRMHGLKMEKRPSEKYYILQIEELYNFRLSKNLVELYKSTYQHTDGKIR